VRRIIAKSFYSNCLRFNFYDTVARLKYSYLDEAFISLSALIGKAVSIFWVRQDGWDGSGSEGNWDHGDIPAELRRQLVNLIPLNHDRHFIE
jgi:hypothetical protein